MTGIDRYRHSYVVTARLSERKPDEAAALETYRAWLERGHSPRYIIAAALNSLDGRRIPPPAPADKTGEAVDAGPIRALLDKRLHEMDALVARLAGAVDDLSNAGQRPPPARQDDEPDNEEGGGISRRFKRSIRAAVDFGDED